MYIINYHTGAGNEVTRRPWWNVAYNGDVFPENNPICFGDYGYYDDWTD